METREDLLERLERLERELSELKEAQAAMLRLPFCIRDEEGHPILQIARTEAGVRLRLLETDGRFLVTLQGIATGGDLAIHGVGGTVMASLAGGPRGGALGLYDTDGSLRAWANVTESGGHMIARPAEADTGTPE